MTKEQRREYMKIWRRNNQDKILQYREKRKLKRKLAKLEQDAQEFNEKILVHPSSKIDPNTILEKAKTWNFDEVIVCGFDKDGEFQFGSSEVLFTNWLLILEYLKDFMRKEIIA